MSNYQPPLTITDKILNLIAQTSELLGRYAERTSRAQALRLRRVNQIRTIHGSLAIEGNSLSLEQITAVLEGKPIIAPPREVQEVKNALAVYERFDQYQPHNEQDLLAAHQLLMAGLVDEMGQYRRGGVGVMRGKEVVHVAPPASRVPQLMQDLFNWLRNTEQADCAPFVEFMLGTILSSLTQLMTQPHETNNLGKKLGKGLTENQQKLLQAL